MKPVALFKAPALRRAGAIVILSFLLISPPMDSLRTAPAEEPATSDVTVPRAALSFVPNVGQMDRLFQFESRSPSGTLGFASDHVVLTLPREVADERDIPAAARAKAAVVRLVFLGANGEAMIDSGSKMPGVVNYLIGNDPNAWLKNVATHKDIVYRDLWPGIDLLYDGTDGRLKGTYLVDAGVDASVIRWRYQGVDGVEIAPNGDARCTVTADGRTMVEEAPIAWQVIDGQKIPVDISYVLDESGELSFDIGAYDSSLPLVIDPTVVYSTLLGGNGTDHGVSVALDDSGHVFVTGRTHSNPLVNGGPGFPVASPIFSYGGEIADAFVTKYDPTGATMMYSTYIGGGNAFDFTVLGGADWGLDIAIGSDGSVYIVGMTESLNFPTTALAIQPAKSGGSTDAFLTKLNAAGDTVLYSTYFGGNSSDFAFSVKLDASDRIYVAGFTGSQNFPVSPGAYQPFSAGGTEGFLAMLDFATPQLYSTYIGFSGDDYLLDMDLADDGTVLVCGLTTSTVDVTNLNPPGVVPFQATNAGGVDAYFARFDLASQGAADLKYWSYLGGTGKDEAWGISAGAGPEVYITGLTGSADLPVELSELPYGGNGDCFVGRFKTLGNGVIDRKYLIYIGNFNYDHGFDVTNKNGDAYVCGMYGNYVSSDAFVIRVSPWGDVESSDVFGGNSFEMALGVAVNANGEVTVVGSTKCPEDNGAGSCAATTFPLLNAMQSSYGGGSSDGFVRVYSQF